MKTIQTINEEDLMIFFNLFINNQILADMSKDRYNAVKTVIIESNWLSRNASKIYTDNCNIKKHTSIINIVTFISHIDDYIDALEILNEYSCSKNELMLHDSDENKKLKKLTNDMISIYEKEHDKLMESLRGDEDDD